MHNIHNLHQSRTLAGGSTNQVTQVFGFDGTDDYISSNATIGRTGYDMNVSGNVSTGSDGDGSYIQFNGNRDATAATGTLAITTGGSTPVFSQATSFTIKDRVKVISLPPNNVTGLFGSVSDTCIHIESQKFRYTVRGSTNTNFDSSVFSLNTLYDLYLVYDAVATKFYCYLGTSGGSSTLLNTGGTSGPATFSTDTWRLGDTAIGAGTPSSCNVYHYHSAIRNKALTQAEVDADIALGNTAKNDPSIVAYYIPDNLQYNTQYIANPKSFGGAGWTIGINANVTANTSVAPDGTTTADTYVINASGTQITNRVEQSITSISGATIASKTFIVKAFVRVVSGSNTFRIKCSHKGVLDYFSSNQVATTTRQEFTFTQTFTSATNGTGIDAGLTSDTSNTAGSFEVRNVRLYLVNETLRDESPNIGGFIGWKTQKVLSFWIKPNIDSVNTADSQSAMRPPRFYCHMSQTTNQLNARYDNRLGSKVSIYNLGTGFRSKVHVSCVYYWTGSVRGTKIYINGFVQDSDTFTVDPPTSSYNTVLWSGRSGTTYFSGNIRDARIYTFTGSFTDADALAIYNGGEPTSAGVTKHLHYRPPVGEVGTTTQDQSINDRDGTLNGGVTRDYI